MMLLVFKSCEHLHKCHSNLFLNAAKCIDSLIAINSLSLVAFPLNGSIAYRQDFLRGEICSH